MWSSPVSLDSVIKYSVALVNISTNTQNNLHVIFNSPNYSILRKHIIIIQNILDKFINIELPENETRNKIIIENLLFDVLYSFISNPFNFESNNSFINAQYDNKKEINNDSYLYQLFKSIEIVIRCSKKGIHSELVSLSLTNNIINTIRSFQKYHNQIDKIFGCEIKAYNYGSTAHTYILEKNNIILKSYHNDFIEICTPVCVNFGLFSFLFSNYIKKERRICWEVIPLLDLLKIKYKLIKGSFKSLQKITTKDDLEDVV